MTDRDDKTKDASRSPLTPPDETAPDGIEEKVTDAEPGNAPKDATHSEDPGSADVHPSEYKKIVAVLDNPGKKAVVEARDVVVRYGPNTILNGVSFDVYEGEIFVILGGSGCGKSTLLRQLIGLETPAEGTVKIDGEDITHAEGRDRERILTRIGALFQSGALFGSMTLAENIALPLREYTNLPEDLIQTLVSLKLDLVNLAGFENHLPSEISGGMKKRAGLARALALDPHILFCDEPSAGLDPISSVELDHLLIELNRSLGLTIVVVTHELDSIFAIAHRVIMLDKSVKNIIATGDPRELKEKSTHPFVRNFFNRQSDGVGSA
ncbi:MAG: ABC transporter ATP-binding protein [Deltaproteobacteria bacterium]|nr:ABC transporter ATP-binding protein [Deltaproteobacteria bacterium]MCB9490322.1 ABC transporter ATP-binding protein [Deltaproteobacteria bacterium]